MRRKFEENKMPCINIFYIKNILNLIRCQAGVFLNVSFAYSSSPVAYTYTSFHRPSTF